MDSQIADVAPTVLKRWPLEVGFQIKGLEVSLELVDLEHELQIRVIRDAKSKWDGPEILSLSSNDFSRLSTILTRNY